MLARTLTEADLPRAAALSARVGWNQVAADWALFLREGRVRGLDDGDPDCLAATAAVLPYGSQVAWVSMVLVRPDRRRAGLATALMRWAMEELAATPCVALDATPAGREVYRRLGFEDVFGFTRWSLPAPLRAEPGIALRPIAAADWPALLALDAVAFGAPREALLRDLQARLPQAAFRTEDGSGFVLAREGLRAPQIGPVVAADEAAAAALVAAAHAALGGPAVIDLADAATALAARLDAAGAERQRPFTRMLRGGAPLGQADRNFAFAGPEFG
jgi:GNAT superfamily N-acetyltransferase